MTFRSGGDPAQGDLMRFPCARCALSCLHDRASPAQRAPLAGCVECVRMRCAGNEALAAACLGLCRQLRPGSKRLMAEENRHRVLHPGDEMQGEYSAQQARSAP